jgi:hypothetical protein
VAVIVVMHRRVTIKELDALNNAWHSSQKAMCLFAGGEAKSTNEDIGARGLDGHAFLKKQQKQSFNRRSSVEDHQTIVGMDFRDLHKATLKKRKAIARKGSVQAAEVQQHTAQRRWSNIKIAIALNPGASLPGGAPPTTK